MKNQINYNYETNFSIDSEEGYSDWICRVINSEGRLCSELSYIFCDDAYLLEINKEYLNHNTYTDIITFDYSTPNSISGDLFISIERVKDNAQKFGISELEELRRVMVHGVLHLLGYKDKEESEIAEMRLKEEEKLEMFHVEQ